MRKPWTKYHKKPFDHENDLNCMKCVFLEWEQIIYSSYTSWTNQQVAFLP